jgi:AAA15 family ATPase/GTPase
MVQFITKGSVNMLSYIKLANFKSFSNIMFDLRGKEGKPKKIALIYGENGSGKSNLMYSMLFLSRTLNTLKNQERLNDLNESKFEDLLSNIDNSTTKNEILRNIFKHQFSTLEDLICEYKTINSKGNLIVEIGFYINGKNGSYLIEFEDDRVVLEELKYQLSERMGTLYSISEDKQRMSPTIFVDSEYKRELKDSIEKYWGKHTFMSILFNEQGNKNFKYIESRINSNLLEVIEWLRRYSVLCKSSHSQSAKVAIPYKLLQNLEEGVVKKKDNKELKVFEQVLNKFFSQLYSDIKKVYYNITERDDGYHYELIVKKLFDGKIIDIPFELESTGTQKLLDVFPYLFMAIRGETVLVDEVDSGIHDLLFYNIIELLEDSLDDESDGQFIATTHNTILMKQLPNDNVYILKTDAEGYKEVVTILDYNFRTQKTNNVQQKYLNGDYSGVPFIGYLDLSELFEDVTAYVGEERHIEEGE